MSGQARSIPARPRLAAGVRPLLAVAAVALLAFFAVYLLAVQTELGQRADEAALAGSSSVPERAQGTANELLRTVSIGSLLAAIAVLSWLAWLRRRPGLLLVPAAVIGISLIATEAFKLVILDRPLLETTSRLTDNSYPSGHTTVATSIALAALLIAPSRWRGAVALGAFALAATAGVFVVTADWHRPSDPIGSYLLTLAVAALCMAWLRSRGQSPATATHVRQRSPGTGPGGLKLELVALLSGAALFVGSGVIASLRYGADVEWNRFHAAFLLSAALIVVVAGLCVAALNRALDSGPGSSPPVR